MIDIQSKSSRAFLSPSWFSPSPLYKIANRFLAHLCCVVDPSRVNQRRLQNRTISYTTLLRHSRSTLTMLYSRFYFCNVPPDHLLLNSAPILGPLISRWEINKLENFWYKSGKFLEVLKLLFQQCLNLSSSQRDMRGPILRALSNNRWSWGIWRDLTNLL
jgi:hypothetical protein